MTKKPKLFRITTVAVSMNIILKGQLAFINQYFEVTGITTRDDKHFPEISKREGIRMIDIPIARNISIWSDIKTLWKLYFLFLKEKPQIVHTQTPKAGLLGMLAAKLSGVPVRLHTVGGMPLMEVKGLKRKILNFTEKLTYACAHKIFPNSKGLSAFILEEKFTSEEKLKVLANGGSNGIDTTFFSPDYVENSNVYREELRTGSGINKHDFVFCFVGRFAKEKGMVELIDVLDKLYKTHRVKLLLVGKFEESYGSLDEEIRKRITNHPAVIYPGRADDVRPYYLMSDAFVFPSYREGFPNTVLEAGAMGLPTIATNINGCNEIIINEVNGLLITPKSEEELEKAMINLLDDKILYNTLKSNAREVIVKKFRREFVWEALLSEYNRFLKSKQT